ncbi:AraC family transcriptional regulator [Dokdonia sinensis]|uniref:AraC family transcriptional regulator n=1 Tax=Dokdonia sinensis TaxID=2479847 RepID=A0A3M0G336_9FLAO|nr:GyrI-like domain-containing protein [Dokdonia sinensis]RMB58567.1 AraC family transcriptional regulator [Dokdonia sinensis]
MKKAIIAIVLILVLGILGYLFVYPYNYQVNFEAKTNPGTLNQSIKSWNSSLENGEIIAQDGWEHLEQKIVQGDSTYIYTWDITPINDSLSKVKVRIDDKENDLPLKLAVPFKKTDFEIRTKATVKEFFDLMNSHLDEIRVTIDGKSITPATYVAYVPLKGLQIEKARGMMQYYSLLTNRMIKYDVELNGPPFVEVTEWNTKTDSIHYNFCFPIKYAKDLPEDPIIKYKRITSKEAIKATYNGNYITSDRAWYALLQYAEDNNLEVEKTPLESFFNNPNMGGDELNWRADIYMPLKAKE